MGGSNSNSSFSSPMITNQPRYSEISKNQTDIFHVFIPFNESPLSNFKKNGIQCFNPLKYLTSTDFNESDLLLGLTKRAESFKIESGYLLGILNCNNYLGEKIKIVKPLHIHQKTNDFLLINDSNTVMAVYQANCDLVLSAIIDPQDTLIFSYNTLVYEDYINVKVISNKECLQEQKLWNILGFIIPFIFWKQHYEKQFENKSLIRIFIRPLSNKKNEDDRWTNESILYITDAKSKLTENIK